MNGCRRRKSGCRRRKSGCRRRKSGSCRTNARRCWRNGRKCRTSAHRCWRNGRKRRSCVFGKASRKNRLRRRRSRSRDHRTSSHIDGRRRRESCVFRSLGLLKNLTGRAKLHWGRRGRHVALQGQPAERGRESAEVCHFEKDIPTLGVISVQRYPFYDAGDEMTSKRTEKKDKPSNSPRLRVSATSMTVPPNRSA